MVPFREKQKYTQWWIWIVLFASACFFAYKIYIHQELIGSLGKHSAKLIIKSLILLILIVLFYFIYLETEIDDSGVTYKFFPFHLKKHTIPWTDIEKAFVRKYKPIREYGGWGYRLGIFGSGKALNISGDKGLQLVLKNGKRLLIGTKKPEEIEKVLLELSSKTIFNR